MMHQITDSTCLTHAAYFCRGKNVEQHLCCTVISLHAVQLFSLWFQVERNLLTNHN